MQLVRDPAGEIAPGEVRLDGDGTHGLQRRVGMIGVVDQDRVLIDLGAFNFHESLTHGLDKTYAGETMLKRGKQADRRGRLAVIHARCRHENPGRDRVAQDQFRAMRVGFEKDGVGHTQSAG